MLCRCFDEFKKEHQQNEKTVDNELNIDESVKTELSANESSSTKLPGFDSFKNGNFKKSKEKEQNGTAVSNEQNYHAPKEAKSNATVDAILEPIGVSEESKVAETEFDDDTQISDSPLASIESTVSHDANETTDDEKITNINGSMPDIVLQHNRVYAAMSSSLQKICKSQAEQSGSDSSVKTQSKIELTEYADQKVIVLKTVTECKQIIKKEGDLEMPRKRMYRTKTTDGQYKRRCSTDIRSSMPGKLLIFSSSNCICTLCISNEK